MFKPKTSKIVLLSTLAAAALVATACSSSSGSSTAASSSTAVGGSSSSAPASGSPIVIANVTSRTGGINQYAFEGIDAWVKYTNASGGIDGHKIELHGLDSKSDATAETVGFQTLASQFKPVAFVGVGTFDMGGDVKVIDGLKIPVIGGQTGETAWNKSAYLYTPGVSFVASEYALAAAAPAGEKKIGQLYCQEAAGCASQNTVLTAPGVMQAAGASLVYSAKISLSAPNYTAECLAAKQAGVQSMVVGSSDLALIRIANDCAAQNFHPQYLIAGVLGTAASIAAPNLDGTIGIMNNFSVGDTSSATAAYRGAMAKYEKKESLDAYSAQAWTGGVLFGEALKNALKAGGTVTAASIQAGLAQVTGNLGGLAPAALKYTTGQPSPLIWCWTSEEIKNKALSTPDGIKPQCVPAGIRPALTTLQGKL